MKNRKYEKSKYKIYGGWSTVNFNNYSYQLVEYRILLQIVNIWCAKLATG